MVNYQCEICFKKFDHKNDYRRHTLRKFSCKPGSNINTELKRHICDKCHREYSRKDHYNNHICISNLQKYCAEEDSSFSHMKTIHNDNISKCNKHPKRKTSSQTKKSRYISRSNEKKLLRKQDFCCANFPGSNLYNIYNYECLLWKCFDGKFDRAGYEVDHVIDHCLTGDNDIDNLQLLCPACHTVKTYNSLENNQNIIS